MRALVSVALACTALLLVAAHPLIAGAGSSTPWRILWPTFKYSMSRSGFLDVRSLYGSFHYRDFKVLWRVKTQLCISSTPAVGDLNGDGRPEVAFSSCDGHLYVVDGATGRILWNSTTGGGFASPTIWDLDGDGKPEVVTMGASGVVYCFNGTGSEEWEVPGRFIRGSVAVADINGDGRYEVLAPSFDGYLYVIEYNGSVVDKIRVGEYPASTPSIADINGDGLPDAVLTDGPDLVVILFHGLGRHSVYHVDLGSILVGPPALAIIGGSHPYAVVVSEDCRVFKVDLARGSIDGEARLPGASECYSAPSIGDVDGDGMTDIVVGSMQGLYVLGWNLTVEYAFPEFKVYTSSPVIADIDGDGRNEILIGQETGEFDIVDISQFNGEPYSEIQWLLKTGGPIMGSAAVADVNGDGMPEILIGSRDFNLYCITGIPAPPAQPTTSTSPATTSNTVATVGVPAGTHRSTQTPSPRASGSLTPGPGGWEARVNVEIVAAAAAFAVAASLLAYIASKR